MRERLCSFVGVAVSSCGGVVYVPMLGSDGRSPLFPASLSPVISTCFSVSLFISLSLFSLSYYFSLPLVFRLLFRSFSPLSLVQSFSPSLFISTSVETIRPNARQFTELCNETREDDRLEAQFEKKERQTFFQRDGCPLRNLLARNKR